jgi:aryl-alcohol dehydrogenase-like predicted oxidoreductase
MRLTTRPLGPTGLAVSPLALAQGGVHGYGPKGLSLTPDDVEAAFHELGVNTFLVYWRWPAIIEGVRRLVKGGHRERLVLLSETGLPGGPFIRRSFERTVRALGVEALDVYLLGWLRSRGGLGLGSWAAIERLKAQGRVRAIGFSSHDRRLAADVAREVRPDVLMLRYNAAHRGAEREVFEVLGENRPAIVAYTATRWGFLLKPHPEQGFPAPMSAGECYRFALTNPAVDTVLCGARTREELRDDVAAVLEGPLSAERHAECARFGDAVHAAARGGQRFMFKEPTISKVR